MSMIVCSFFFFKQKTAYEMRISDWGSDVCSPDLDDGDESSGAGAPEPVDVTSDAPRHATLEDLVTAADVVLTGELVGTDGGRIFGDPDSDAAIESSMVTLEVAEVLVGSPVADLAGGDTVLVAEEERKRIRLHSS